MPKLWSINTTTRNPSRTIDFLKVLSEFEGEIFDEKTQKEYQKRLIKRKKYLPNNVSGELKMEYEDDTDPYSDKDTEIMFSTVNDPAKRGRTSVSRLTHMGLAIAKKSEGAVVITELGNKLLKNEITLEEHFLKHFLKWQFPNPIQQGYKNFDMKPFLCTLYIINKVNSIEILRKNKAKGISKEEFGIFIVTLRDYHEIDYVCEEIIKYRDNLKKSENKNQFKKEYTEKIIKEIFKEDISKKILENKLKKKNRKTNDDIIKKIIETKFKTITDYADSAIRWFRLTGLIMYRGEKRYIDISNTRSEEVKKIIEKIPLSSEHYNNTEDYRNYLINENEPPLPWENSETIKGIILKLGRLIKECQTKIDKEFPYKRKHDFKTDLNNPPLKFKELKKIEKEYRENLDTIEYEYKTLQESNLNNLKKYMEKLNEYSDMSRKLVEERNIPLCFEWYTSLSLMALDDAIQIKPNLKRGDDGIPSSTAGGNVPDIECYYKNFNLSVEVTLMKGRNQVNNELEPNFRHYLDFKHKNNKNTYGLFIAPRIHNDFLNLSLAHISIGYNNEKNINLIFLTTEQYNNILKIVLNNFEKGKQITHEKFERLLKECSEISKKEEIQGDSTKYYPEINKIINEWEKIYF